MANLLLASELARLLEELNSRRDRLQSELPRLEKKLADATEALDHHPLILTELTKTITDVEVLIAENTA